MRRPFELEILEREGLPESDVARAYRDLTRIHRWLGDTTSVRFRGKARPAARAAHPRHRLRQGRRAPRSASPPGSRRGGRGREAGAGGSIPDHQGGRRSGPSAARRHRRFHVVGAPLSERQLINLIRNVGQSCRRFILLDLVRHPLPLRLFNLFVAPLVSSVTAAHGRTSICRAYTPAELTDIAEKAIGGSGARFSHSIAPLYIRQTLDFSYSI